MAARERLEERVGNGGPSGGIARQRPLVLVGFASALSLLLLVLMADRSGVSIADAVADPHEVTRLRFLGIVSNVGLLLWAATIAVCVLAAATVEPAPDQRWRAFFVVSGLVTSVLLIDDLILVHEFADDVVAVFVDFDRTRQQKDILEALVFAAYGAMFLWYCFRYRVELLGATERRFFIAAAAMFALSLLFDFDAHSFVGLDLPDYRSDFDVESLAEEGPKFVGITYYLWFYLLTARSVLRGDGSSDLEAPNT